MVWIALALMGLSVILVLLNTAGGRWGMGHWRGPRRPGQTWQEWNAMPTYRQYVEQMVAVRMAMPGQAPAGAIQDSIGAACGAVLDRSDFLVFSRVVVFSVFLSFLLPMWSLSFATEALGGERESNSMLWLLTRPLPRPSIYLAKFMALLPWSLGLNLVGFVLLCLASGRPGLMAIRLFWPAVVCGTLAFSALFHFMGAFLRRPAIVAIVYSFFLETIMGNMPGYMKRLSISFYARCMMYDAAQVQGLQPEKPSIYLPVDGSTACWVLVGVTVALLVIGMVWFSRTEYRDAAT
jgi:ABC-type transport system involved in multi-copper enzyme maturation permease subunit